MPSFFDEAPALRAGVEVAEKVEDSAPRFYWRFSLFDSSIAFFKTCSSRFICV